jgi:carbon storage regulator
MLVLTRRLGETVVIGGGIRVTVVEVSGNTIRLGITAPPAVAVDREEVHERRLELVVRPGRATEDGLPCGDILPQTFGPRKGLIRRRAGVCRLAN